MAPSVYERGATNLKNRAHFEVLLLEYEELV